MAIDAYIVKGYNTINLTNISIIKANIVANAKYYFEIMLYYLI